MSSPIFVSVDGTGKMPDLTEARFVRSNIKGVASGVALLDSSGKVVDATGTRVTQAADIATATAPLVARDHVSEWIIRSVAGVWPARPVTPDQVTWKGSPQPTFDGTITNGLGMVPDLDEWEVIE